MVDAEIRNDGEVALRAALFDNLYSTVRIVLEAVDAESGGNVRLFSEEFADRVAQRVMQRLAEFAPGPITCDVCHTLPCECPPDRRPL